MFVSLVNCWESFSVPLTLRCFSCFVWLIAIEIIMPVFFINSAYCHIFIIII